MEIRETFVGSQSMVILVKLLVNTSVLQLPRPEPYKMFSNVFSRNFFEFSKNFLKCVPCCFSGKYPFYTCAPVWSPQGSSDPVSRSGPSPPHWARPL